MSSQANSTESRARLWFGVACAPTAWVVHGLSSVVVMSVACRHGQAALARGVVIGLTLVAAVFTLWATWLGYKGGHALREGHDSSEHEEQTLMIARLSFLVGIGFTVGVLWGGLPAFIIGDLCEAIR
jgi:hypothetical protein